MSVAYSNDTRYYDHHGTNSKPMGPPQYTCSAVLCDRKFIASNGPPPTVDAHRLAQTLNNLNHSVRAVKLYIYHDRLLIRSLSRDPELPDILFDDIMQLETIPGRQSFLFILCGRRGIGTYYFFKLSTISVAEKIVELVRLAYPNLNSNDHSKTRKEYLHPHAGHSPSKENHTSRYRRSSWEYGASSFALSESTCSSPTPDRQNSFIRWEGYRKNKNPILDRDPRNSSARKGEPKMKIARSLSKNRAGDNRGITKKGPLLIKRNGERKKQDQFVILEDNQMRSKPIARSNNRYDRNKDSSRHRLQGSKPRSVVPVISTNTVKHRGGPVQRVYDDSGESNYTSREVQISRQRYQGNEYEDDLMDDFDWESNDSWDLRDARSMNHFEGGNFGGNENGNVYPVTRQYSADELSYSSEDSLYLEREQELASRLPNRGTDYLPELRQKFRRFNLC